MLYIFVIKIIVDCLLPDPKDVAILGELWVNNFLCPSSYVLHNYANSYFLTYVVEFVGECVSEFVCLILV